MCFASTLAVLSTSVGALLVLVQMLMVRSQHRVVTRDCSLCGVRIACDLYRQRILRGSHVDADGLGCSAGLLIPSEQSQCGRSRLRMHADHSPPRLQSMDDVEGASALQACSICFGASWSGRSRLRRPFWQAACSTPSCVQEAWRCPGTTTS